VLTDQRKKKKDLGKMNKFTGGAKSSSEDRDDVEK